MPPRAANDITRTTLQVIWIGLLLSAALWVLKPFLPSLIWSATIVVTTWPILLRLERLFGGRRAPAVAGMAVLLVLLFLVPFTLAILTIIDNAGRITGWVRSLNTLGLPPPPDWIDAIPLVGARLSGMWRHVTDAGPEAISEYLTPYAGAIASWFIDQAGNIGLVLVQILLTVILSSILYARGEEEAARLRRFAERLGGSRAEAAVVLAGRAVRGIALGIVVTAVVQSTLGGIGLFAAGVPAASLLTALMFILCIAQLGPGPILFPAVVWLFWNEETVAASALLVWTILCVTLDNVVRPFLIRKGADLPILMIFAGVMGGLIAFGVVGLFVGPVVLAVGFTLLDSWIEAGREMPTPPVDRGGNG